MLIYTDCAQLLWQTKCWKLYVCTQDCNALLFHPINSDKKYHFVNIVNQPDDDVPSLEKDLATLYSTKIFKSVSTSVFQHLFGKFFWDWTKVLSIYDKLASQKHIETLPHIWVYFQNFFSESNFNVPRPEHIMGINDTFKRRYATPEAIVGKGVISIVHEYQLDFLWSDAALQFGQFKQLGLCYTDIDYCATMERDDDKKFFFQSLANCLCRSALNYKYFKSHITARLRWCNIPKDVEMMLHCTKQQYKASLAAIRKQNKARKKKFKRKQKKQAAREKKNNQQPAESSADSVEPASAQNHAIDNESARAQQKNISAASQSPFPPSPNHFFHPPLSPSPNHFPPQQPQYPHFYPFPPQQRQYPHFYPSAPYHYPSPHHPPLSPQHQHRMGMQHKQNNDVMLQMQRAVSHLATPRGTPSRHQPETFASQSQPSPLGSVQPPQSPPHQPLTTEMSQDIEPLSVLPQSPAHSITVFDENVCVKVCGLQSQQEKLETIKEDIIQFRQYLEHFENQTLSDCSNKPLFASYLECSDPNKSDSNKAWLKHFISELVDIWKLLSKIDANQRAEGITRIFEQYMHPSREKKNENSAGLALHIARYLTIVFFMRYKMSLFKTNNSHRVCIDLHIASNLEQSNSIDFIDSKWKVWKFQRAEIKIEEVNTPPIKKLSTSFLSDLFSSESNSNSSIQSKKNSANESLVPVIPPRAERVNNSNLDSSPISEPETPFQKYFTSFMSVFLPYFKRNEPLVKECKSNFIKLAQWALYNKMEFRLGRVDEQNVYVRVLQHRVSHKFHLYIQQYDENKLISDKTKYILHDDINSLDDDLIVSLNEFCNVSLDINDLSSPDNIKDILLSIDIHPRVDLANWIVMRHLTYDELFTVFMQHFHCQPRTDLLDTLEKCLKNLDKTLSRQFFWITTCEKDEHATKVEFYDKTIKYMRTCLFVLVKYRQRLADVAIFSGIINLTKDSQKLAYGLTVEFVGQFAQSADADGNNFENTQILMKKINTIRTYYHFKLVNWADKRVIVGQILCKPDYNGGKKWKFILIQLDHKNNVVRALKDGRFTSQKDAKALFLRKFHNYTNFEWDARGDSSKHDKGSHWQYVLRPLKGHQKIDAVDLFYYSAIRRCQQHNLSIQSFSDKFKQCLTWHSSHRAAFHFERVDKLRLKTEQKLAKKKDKKRKRKQESKKNRSEERKSPSPHVDIANDSILLISDDESTEKSKDNLQISQQSDKHEIDDFVQPPHKKRKLNSSKKSSKQRRLKIKDSMIVSSTDSDAATESDTAMHNNAFDRAVLIMKTPPLDVIRQHHAVDEDNGFFVQEDNNRYYLPFCPVADPFFSPSYVFEPWQSQRKTRERTNLIQDMSKNTHADYVCSKRHLPYETQIAEFEARDNLYPITPIEMIKSLFYMSQHKHPCNGKTNTKPRVLQSQLYFLSEDKQKEIKIRAILDKDEIMDHLIIDRRKVEASEHMTGDWIFYTSPNWKTVMSNEHFAVKALHLDDHFKALYDVALIVDTYHLTDCYHKIDPHQGKETYWLPVKNERELEYSAKLKQYLSVSHMEKYRITRQQIWTSTKHNSFLSLALAKDEDGKIAELLKPWLLEKHRFSPSVIHVVASLSEMDPTDLKEYFNSYNHEVYKFIIELQHVHKLDLFYFVNVHGNLVIGPKEYAPYPFFDYYNADSPSQLTDFLLGHIDNLIFWQCVTKVWEQNCERGFMATGYPLDTHTIYDKNAGKQQRADYRQYLLTVQSNFDYYGSLIPNCRLTADCFPKKKPRLTEFMIVGQGSKVRGFTLYSPRKRSLRGPMYNLKVGHLYDRLDSDIDSIKRRKFHNSHSHAFMQNAQNNYALNKQLLNLRESIFPLSDKNMVQWESETFVICRANTALSTDPPQYRFMILHRQCAVGHEFVYLRRHGYNKHQQQDKNVEKIVRMNTPSSQWSAFQNHWDIYNNKEYQTQSEAQDALTAKFMKRTGQTQIHWSSEYKQRIFSFTNPKSHEQKIYFIPDDLGMSAIEKISLLEHKNIKWPPSHWPANQHAPSEPLNKRADRENISSCAEYKDIYSRIMAFDVLSQSPNSTQFTINDKSDEIVITFHKNQDVQALQFMASPINQPKDSVVRVMFNVNVYFYTAQGNKYQIIDINAIGPAWQRGVLRLTNIQKILLKFSDFTQVFKVSKLCIFKAKKKKKGVSFAVREPTEPNEDNDDDDDNKNNEDGDEDDIDVQMSGDIESNSNPSEENKSQKVPERSSTDLNNRELLWTVFGPSRSFYLRLDDSVRMDEFLKEKIEDDNKIRSKICDFLIGLRHTEQHPPCSVSHYNNGQCCDGECAAEEYERMQMIFHPNYLNVCPLSTYASLDYFDFIPSEQKFANAALSIGDYKFRRFHMNRFSNCYFDDKPLSRLISANIQSFKVTHCQSFQWGGFDETTNEADRYELIRSYMKLYVLKFKFQTKRPCRMPCVFDSLEHLLQNDGAIASFTKNNLRPEEIWQNMIKVSKLHWEKEHKFHQVVEMFVQYAQSWFDSVDTFFQTAHVFSRSVQMCICFALNDLILGYSPQCPLDTAIASRRASHRVPSATELLLDLGHQSFKIKLQAYLYLLQSNNITMLPYVVQHIDVQNKRIQLRSCNKQENIIKSKTELETPRALDGEPNSLNLVYIVSHSKRRLPVVLSDCEKTERYKKQWALDNNCIRLQIDGLGDCLAMAVSLFVYNDVQWHPAVRQDVLDWIIQHQRSFRHFVPGTDAEFHAHISKLRAKREHLTYIFVAAAAQRYRIPIAIWEWNYKEMKFIQSTVYEWPDVRSTLSHRIIAYDDFTEHCNVLIFAASMNDPEICENLDRYNNEENDRIFTWIRKRSFFEEGWNGELLMSNECDSFSKNRSNNLLKDAWDKQLENVDEEQVLFSNVDRITNRANRSQQLHRLSKQWTPFANLAKIPTSRMNYLFDVISNFNKKGDQLLLRNKMEPYFHNIGIDQFFVWCFMTKSSLNVWDRFTWLEDNRGLLQLKTSLEYYVRFLKTNAHHKVSTFDDLCRHSYSQFVVSWNYIYFQAATDDETESAVINRHFPAFVKAVIKSFDNQQKLNDFLWGILSLTVSDYAEQIKSSTFEQTLCPPICFERTKYLRGQLYTIFLRENGDDPHATANLFGDFHGDHMTGYLRELLRVATRDHITDLGEYARDTQSFFNNIMENYVVGNKVVPVDLRETVQDINELSTQISQIHFHAKPLEDEHIEKMCCDMATIAYWESMRIDCLYGLATSSLKHLKLCLLQMKNGQDFATVRDRYLMLIIMEWCFLFVLRKMNDYGQKDKRLHRFRLLNEYDMNDDTEDNAVYYGREYNNVTTIRYNDQMNYLRINQRLLLFEIKDVFTAEQMQFFPAVITDILFEYLVGISLSDKSAYPSKLEVALNWMEDTVLRRKKHATLLRVAAYKQHPYIDCTGSKKQISQSFLTFSGLMPHIKWIWNQAQIESDFLFLTDGNIMSAEVDPSSLGSEYPAADMTACVCRRVVHMGNCESNMCQHVATNTFCSDTVKMCSKMDLCQNRSGSYQVHNLHIFSSPTKKFGVSLSKCVRSGAKICEYSGVIRKKTLDEISELGEKYGNLTKEFVAFQIDDVWYVIDATKRGSKAKFMSSSCHPNAELQRWTDVGGDHDLHFIVVATRNINEGEEIFWNNFTLCRDQHGQTESCECASPGCHGEILINGVDENQTKVDVVKAIRKYMFDNSLNSTFQEISCLVHGCPQIHLLAKWMEDNWPAQFRTLNNEKKNIIKIACRTSRHIQQFSSLNAPPMKVEKDLFAIDNIKNKQILKPWFLDTLSGKKYLVVCNAQIIGTPFVVGEDTLIRVWDGETLIACKINPLISEKIVKKYGSLNEASMHLDILQNVKWTRRPAATEMWMIYLLSTDSIVSKNKLYGKYANCKYATHHTMFRAMYNGKIQRPITFTDAITNSENWAARMGDKAAINMWRKYDSALPIKNSFDWTKNYFTKAFKTEWKAHLLFVAIYCPSINISTLDSIIDPELQSLLLLTALFMKNEFDEIMKKISRLELKSFAKTKAVVEQILAGWKQEYGNITRKANRNKIFSANSLKSTLIDLKLNKHFVVRIGEQIDRRNRFWFTHIIQVLREKGKSQDINVNTSFTTAQQKMAASCYYGSNPNAQVDRPFDWRCSQNNQWATTENVIETYKSRDRLTNDKSTAFINCYYNNLREQQRYEFMATTDLYRITSAQWLNTSIMDFLLTAFLDNIWDTSSCREFPVHLEDYHLFSATDSQRMIEKYSQMSFDDFATELQSRIGTKKQKRKSRTRWSQYLFAGRSIVIINQEEKHWFVAVFNFYMFGMKDADGSYLPWIDICESMVARGHKLGAKREKLVKKIVTFFNMAFSLDQCKASDVKPKYVQQFSCTKDDYRVLHVPQQRKALCGFYALFFAQCAIWYKNLNDCPMFKDPEVQKYLEYTFASDLAKKLTAARKMQSDIRSRIISTPNNSNNGNGDNEKNIDSNAMESNAKKKIKIKKNNRRKYGGKRTKRDGDDDEDDEYSPPNKKKRRRVSKKLRK